MNRIPDISYATLRAGGLAAAVLLGPWAASSQAGEVDPPLVIDEFHSYAIVELLLLPSWTGLPSPIPVTVEVSSKGPDPKDLKSETIIPRELDAQGTPDTIDVEIQSLRLAGETVLPSGLTVDVAVAVGEDAGFEPGLPRTGGQVREFVGGAPNGVIDVFPVESIFDVFHDIWIDLDGDWEQDPGEVLRNFEGATRMANAQLSSLPPNPDGSDPYDSTNETVEITDPLIGEFGATPIPGPTDLYVVLPGGGQGPLHAQLLSVTHIPWIPEPSTLLLCLGAAVGIVPRSVRKRAAA